MTTSFDYPLHATTRRQLERIVGNPGHAYLLYGPRYMYKLRSAEQLALELAQATNLDHPNIIRLSAKESKSIKIADVKQLLEKLSLTAFDVSTQRIVIIEQAHTMTNDASNALLKALEEPGDGVVFLLVTDRLQNMLATIRSRTQLVSFVTIGEGQPRLAPAMAEDDNLRLSYEQAIGLATRYVEGGLSDRFAVAQQVADKKTEGMFTEVLEQQLLAEGDRQNWKFEVLAKLLRAEDAMSHNVSSRLCLENLALELAL